MAEAKRAVARKATIEIQRRPGRSGTITGRRGQQMEVAAAGVQRAAAASPADIPKCIEAAFTPDGFDESSSILACNFPSDVNINQCRSFFSWVGPVVRVDRATSVGNECNFLVVFATTEHLQKALKAPLFFDAEKRITIYVRMCDPRLTWKSKITAYFQHTPAPAQPTAVSTGATGGASTWLSNAGQTAGTAFATAGNSLTEGWSHAEESIKDAWGRASTTVQGYVG